MDLYPGGRVPGFSIGADRARGRGGRGVVVVEPGHDALGKEYGGIRLLPS